MQLKPNYIKCLLLPYVLFPNITITLSIKFENQGDNLIMTKVVVFFLVFLIVILGWR